MSTRKKRRGPQGRVLLPEQEKAVAAAWRKGARQVDLARKYRVTQPTISRILSRLLGASDRRKA